MLNRFKLGRLMIENDGTSSGGGTTTPDAVAAPDIAKLLTSMQESMTATFSKSISDMRKEMQQANDATNTRLKMVIDDLVEGATTSTPHTTLTTTTTTPNTSSDTTPMTTTTNNLVEDAIKLTAIAERRKLKESEDAKRQLEIRLEQLARDNNQIRIESAVNSAMAKLNWADGTYDIVANQMISKAEIDADGKVKMGGMEPSQFISKFHAGNLWAQPAAPSAGSGNSGGASRRADGSIDLKNYDPAKVDPNSPEFKKLIQQTREQFGGG